MLSMSSSHLIPAIYRSCLIGRRCSTIPDTGGRSSLHISIPTDAAAMSIMLMSPHDIEEAKAVYREQRRALLTVSENAEILGGLEAIEELIEAKRYYDALRRIRALFDVEQSILSGSELPRPVEIA